MRETQTQTTGGIDVFAACAADRYTELYDYDDDAEDQDNLKELLCDLASDLRGLSRELETTERPNLTYLNSGCDALLAVYDSIKTGSNLGFEWKDEIYSRLAEHGDIVVRQTLNEIMEGAAAVRLEEGDLIDSLAKQYTGLLQELEDRAKTRVYDASPYRLNSIARNEAGKEQRLEGLVSTLKETLTAIVLESDIAVTFDRDLCQEMISFVFGMSKAKAICFLADREQAGFRSEVVERAQKMINDANIDRARSILASLTMVLEGSDDGDGLEEITPTH